MADHRTIHVVEDDEAVRRSVAFMLKREGYKIIAWASGVEFLAGAKNTERGVVLLDIRMPGMDGLEVQQEIIARGIDMPIIVLTGHGDVVLAVKAMRAGAVNFIEKPYEKAELLAALNDGFARLNRGDEGKMLASQAQVRLASLTGRERDVLDGLIEGFPNKTIAYDLGISPRTVEIYRANMMEKLRVRSLSEALRIAFIAGESDAATMPPTKLSNVE
ncbi:MAG: response regulator [Parasphingorhabdus sp.]|nr:response regulator [Parasphingorhabdus sp.]